MVCSVLVVLSVIIVFSLSMHYNAGVNVISDGGNLLNRIYYKPWCRFGPYAAGVMFGFMYYEDQTNHNAYFSLARKKQVFRILLFVVGLIITTVTVWLPYYEYKDLLGKSWPRGICALYNSATRLVFVIALGMILTGACVGKGRLIRFFLAGEFWSPWAKLSFMCYMVHIPVMLWFLAQI